MGTEISQDVWRGVALLHPDLTTEDALWDAESSFTEAEPVAGECVPSQTTPLNFRAYGSQTAGGTVSLRVATPGFAGPRNRLGVLRKGPSSAAWGGWDPPAIVQDVTAPAWNGVVSQESTHPVIAVDADGYAVVVYQEDDGGATYKILSQTFDPTTNTFGAAVTVLNYGTTSPPYDGRASVHVAADGAFICTALVFEDTNDTINLRVFRSTDRGATWSTVSRYALDQPLQPNHATSGLRFDNVDRLRTAESNGQTIALLRVDSTNSGSYTAGGTKVLQWCSVDGGLTYRTVIGQNDLATQADIQYAHHDVATTPDGFVVAYVAGGAGTNQTLTRVLPNGFMPFHSAPSVAVNAISAIDAIGDDGGTPPAVDEGELTIWTDETGVYYLMVTALDLTGDPTLIYRSRDNLESWDGLSEGDRLSGVGQVFDTASATTKPTRFCARAHRGGALWAANCESVGNVDNDLFVMRLGGWSSVVMPSIGLTLLDTERASWLRVGLPFDLPDAANWVKTTTGGTAALAAGPVVSIDTQTGGPYQLYYGDTPQGSLGEGYITQHTVRVAAGGSIGSESVGIKLILSGGGTDEYEVTLRISTTQARLYDDVAGAAVATVSGLSSSNYYTFRIALTGDSSNGSVKAWYREADFSDDQEWTEIGSSTTLTKRVLGSAGTNTIRWGHLSSTSSVTNWRQWHYTSDQYTGFQMVTQANPGDLIGRPVGPSDSPTYCIDGLSITAIGGPGREGDEYTIAAGSSFDWTRLLPLVSASPRVPFRSVSASTPGSAVPAQQFAFRLDSGLTAAGQESRWPTDVLIVDLRGFNGRDVQVEGYGSGAWASLADVTAVVASGEMTRTGKTVQFTDGSATTSNRYIPADYLAGGTVKLAASPELFKIEGNESGVLRPSGDSKDCVIRIEGATASSPTTYASAEVWSPNLCIVIPLNGQKLAGVRVSLKSQVTADDYLELGSLGIYYGVGLQEWSNGWVYQIEPNAEITEQTSGTRVGRKNGPAREIWELAWIDPINTTPIRGENPSPDFYAATGNSGYLAFGMPAETPDRLMAMLDQTGGPTQPTLVLPRVDYVENGGTDAAVLRLPHQSHYGRFTGGLRVEHVTGNEDNGPTPTAASFIGPVYRVARLIHEGEV